MQCIIIIFVNLLLKSNNRLCLVIEEDIRNINAYKHGIVPRRAFIRHT